MRKVALAILLALLFTAGFGIANHESITELHPWSATVTVSHGKKQSLLTVSGTVTDSDPVVHPTTVTVTTTGTTTIGTTTTTPPPTSGYLISSTGSDANPCTTAAPCLSFARAVNVVPSGSVIDVSGSLGNQFFACGANSSQGCTTKTLTFNGLTGNKIRQIHFGSGNFTFDGIHVDAGATRTTGAGFENGGQAFVFKNGSIGNVVDEKGSLVDGPGVVFDNVRFHDVVLRTDGVHLECIMALWVPQLVIKNSRFENCAIMDLSLGYPGWWNPLPPPYEGVVLDNNFWGVPRVDNGECCAAYGLAIWANQYTGTCDCNFGVMRNYHITNNFFESAGINRMSVDSTTIISGNTGNTGWLP